MNRVERIQDALENDGPVSTLAKALATWGNYSPVVYHDGKWLPEGVIAYFQGILEIVRTADPLVPPGLPLHCLDPYWIAEFLGISVEELNWPEIATPVAIAGSLEHIEAKLDSNQPVAHAGSDFVAMQEATAITGFSYSHIRRAVVSSKLPASNNGSTQRPIYRIARKDLAEWMDKKKGGTTPEVPPSSKLKDLIECHLPGLRGRKDSTTR